MSKGSKIVNVRVSDELYGEMLAAMDSRNNHTSEQPWNISDFIRYSIRVKLAHIARSKSNGRHKSKAKKQSAQRAES